jgi:hypothetical protein
MTARTKHNTNGAADANGTPVYARQHKRGLTLPQQNAVDLLASGKNDTETAEQLNLSRTCVTKWRLYDPVFQAALNQRRAEVWGAGIDRLRSLIPQALNVLADELEKPDSPNRFKAAGEILRLAQLPAGALGIGPTDAEEIVRRVVEERRQQAHGPLDDFLDDGKGLPRFGQHVEEVWQELEARAAEPDEPVAD